MTTLLRYDLTTDPFPLQASPAPAPLQAQAEARVPPQDLSGPMYQSAGESPPGEQQAVPDSLPVRFDGQAEAPVVAVLTIVASNPNADPDKNPVTLRGLSITVPVGPNATDLTADAANLGPVAPGGWTLSVIKPSAGAVEYVFEPQASQGAVGKRGLVFVFNTVTVNTQPGTAQVTVREGSAGSPTRALFVTKFPNGWGTVSFWLDPPVVPFESPTTLHWSGPSGATYTIQYALDGQVYSVPAQGEPALGNQGQYPAQGDPPLTLDQTTVFTLSVEQTINNVEYNAQEQKTATVQVPAPAISSFAAVPSIVNAQNTPPVRLQWATKNASELTVANVGNFTGPEVASGSTGVSPSVVAPVSVFSYFATGYGLAGYSGPPALGQADILFTWSATSSWCAVWDAAGGNFWSLKLWDGRDALDLSLVVTDNPSGQYREVYANLPAGVLAANFGSQGAATPASAWANPQWGGSYANSQLYVGVGEYDSEQAMNVGQTWGLKFPDGRLVLLWYASGNSNGEYIFSDSWQFTFGWTYFNPHAS